MQMTPDEIATDYLQAKDPAMQRRILADLNTCTISEIDEILEGRGIQVKKPKQPARPKNKLDRKLARKLYDAGKNDREIASACGVTKFPVLDWRNKNKLPPNVGPGGRRFEG